MLDLGWTCGLCLMLTTRSCRFAASTTCLESSGGERALRRKRMRCCWRPYATCGQVPARFLESSAVWNKAHLLVDGLRCGLNVDDLKDAHAESSATGEVCMFTAVRQVLSSHIQPSFRHSVSSTSSFFIVPGCLPHCSAISFFAPVLDPSDLQMTLHLASTKGDTRFEPDRIRRI